MKKKCKAPHLVYADLEGNIYDTPILKMMERSGRDIHPVLPETLIPLPDGSELFILPERHPTGWDEKTQRPVILYENPERPGEKVYAVAAFISPAHTLTALAAFKKSQPASSPLPLFAYGAVGWWKNRFWVAAFRSDPDKRQDLKNFDENILRAKTFSKLEKFKHNRLIQHLGRCCLTYGCPAAKNFFLARWEAPIPTSPNCNARCMGCISQQPEDGPPATQERIKFIPTPEEILELAAPHLKNAERAIVSFGQGCEGEPLLQAGLLEEAIRKIRKETDKGTINLNTNGSRPEIVESLINAGLDSIRISMNSVREPYYTKYYRPRGYRYKDVLKTWEIMKKAGRFVSINLFVLPGLTDEPDEFERLTELIETFGLDLIQLRNHNIDPDWYLDHIGYKKSGKAMGIKNMIKKLKRRFPGLRFGYFNPPLR